MSSIIFFCTLFLSASVQAWDDTAREDKVESEDRDNKAFESIDSPVYGVNDISKSAGFPGLPKSGYSAPFPPQAAIPAGYSAPLALRAGIPAGYSAYLNSLGYGSPYGQSSYGSPYGSVYNRFGVMPYSVPYYGYGAYSAAPLNALGYGYGSGYVPGYGYGAGLPYVNPYMGRTAYNMLGYGGYPYSGLGYRFGGLGYSAARLRAAPVAPGIPAPVPAPVPQPVPAAPAYGTPIGSIQGKDGSLRPGYAPVGGQRLPIY